MAIGRYSYSTASRRRIEGRSLGAILARGRQVGAAAPGRERPGAIVEVDEAGHGVEVRRVREDERFGGVAGAAGGEVAVLEVVVELEGRLREPDDAVRADAPRAVVRAH